MCSNNPPLKGEDQSELQEYCQPLKVAIPLRFADGTPPRYANVYYHHLETRVGKNSGIYQVTSPDAQTVFEWLREQFTWKAEMTVPENTLVHVDHDRVLIYALRKGRIYQYNAYGSGANEDKKNSSPPTDLAHQFLKNFRVRAPFEIPQEPGACIPHGFIAAMGKVPRRVSVAFRLKSYPGVEIYFMEEQYGTNNAETISDGFKIPRIADILGDDEETNIQITGRNGKAVFKEIVNQKNSQGYAYMASAAGYALAAREMPGLRFYLISNGESATGTRLSKKEVLAMAQRIVASIKRRVPD